MIFKTKAPADLDKVRKLSRGRSWSEHDDKDFWEGTIGYNRAGRIMTIIHYRTPEDIDVIDSDGNIFRTNMFDFRFDGILYEKQLRHDHYLHRSKKSFNGLMLKIEKVNTGGITVRFEDGTLIESTYAKFNQDKIRHPLFIQRKTWNTWCGIKTRYIHDKYYEYECSSCMHKGIDTAGNILAQHKNCISRHTDNKNSSF